MHNSPRLEPQETLDRKNKTAYEKLLNNLPVSVGFRHGRLIITSSMILALAYFLVGLDLLTRFGSWLGALLGLAGLLLGFIVGRHVWVRGWPLDW